MPPMFDFMNHPLAICSIKYQKPRNCQIKQTSLPFTLILENKDVFAFVLYSFTILY